MPQPLALVITRESCMLHPSELLFIHFVLLSSSLMKGNWRCILNFEGGCSEGRCEACGGDSGCGWGCTVPWNFKWSLSDSSHACTASQGAEHQWCWRLPGGWSLHEAAARRHSCRSPGFRRGQSSSFKLACGTFVRVLRVARREQQPVCKLWTSQHSSQDT